MKMCMTYLHGKRAFCWIHILQGGLKVWLPMKFSQLAEPPAFARDMTNVGHWGGGDVELIIHDSGQAQQAAPLIRQAFELQQQRAAKS